MSSAKLYAKQAGWAALGVGLGLLALPLLVFAWRLNTGQAELTRWNEVTISSKDALFFATLILGALMATKFAERRWRPYSKKYNAFFAVFFVLMYGVANALGAAAKF